VQGTTTNRAKGAELVERVVVRREPRRKQDYAQRPTDKVSESLTHNERGGGIEAAEDRLCKRKKRGQKKGTKKQATRRKARREVHIVQKTKETSPATDTVKKKRGGWGWYEEAVFGKAKMKSAVSRTEQAVQ